MSGKDDNQEHEAGWSHFIDTQEAESEDRKSSQVIKLHRLPQVMYFLQQGSTPLSDGSTSWGPSIEIYKRMKDIFQTDTLF